VAVQDRPGGAVRIAQPEAGAVGFAAGDDGADAGA